MRLIWHKLQQTQESLTENTNQTAVDVTTTCKGKPQTSFLNPSSLLWSDLCGDVNRNERAQRRHLEHKTSLVSGSHESSRIYICTYCTVHNSTRHRNGTLQATPRNSCTVMLFSQQPVARLEESLTQRHKAQAPCNMTYIHTHTCIA